MSFTLQISTILQYAYNVFASALPMIYLFIGATFGAFVLAKLLNLAKG
jgi:ACR3 family arsenite efflux pump ArsB